jgi:hypothetical protein
MAMAVVCAVGFAGCIGGGHGVPTAAPQLPKTATSTIHAKQLARYGQLTQETAQESGGTQPPNQPVGSGWSVPEPSLSKSVPSEWSPLVTSALEVFEHETHKDQPAALSFVLEQNPSQVGMPQGMVEIETLHGLVNDGSAGSWTISATSQQPFSAGGSVMFMGGCTFTTSGISKGATGSATSQSGTCTDLLVTLVGDPTNPYSAGVAQWSGRATRAAMTKVP